MPAVAGVVVVVVVVLVVPILCLVVGEHPILWNLGRERLRSQLWPYPMQDQELFCWP